MLTNQNPELIYSCKIAGADISIKMFLKKNSSGQTLLQLSWRSGVKELSAHDFYIYKKGFWAVLQEDVRGGQIKINLRL